MATCTLSATLQNIDGSARAGVIGTVRLWKSPEASLSGPLYSGAPITSTSDGNGLIEWTVPQDIRVIVNVPDFADNVAVWIPKESTANLATIMTSRLASSNVVSREWNNAIGRVATLEATAAGLADPDDMVITPDGATVGTDLSEIMAREYWVHNYGSFTEGTGQIESVRTANAATLQAAIDAVIAAGGGKLRIKSGTYELNGSVTIDKASHSYLYFHMEGMGKKVTILSWNNVSRVDGLVVERSHGAAYSGYWSLRNMTLKADSGTCRNVLHVEGASYYDIEKVEIDATNASSCFFLGTSLSGSIVDCEFRYGTKCRICIGTAYSAGGNTVGTTTKFYNCYVVGLGGRGPAFRILNAGGTIIESCTIESNYFGGIEVGVDVHVGAGEVSETWEYQGGFFGQGVILLNNHFEGNAGALIHISTSTRCQAYSYARGVVYSYRNVFLHNQTTVWDNSVTYASGALVHYSNKHYRSLQGSNLNNTPAGGAPWWEEVSDNPYGEPCMFLLGNTGHVISERDYVAGYPGMSIFKYNYNSLQTQEIDYNPLPTLVNNNAEQHFENCDANLGEPTKGKWTYSGLERAVVRYPEEYNYVLVGSAWDSGTTYGAGEIVQYTTGYYTKNYISLAGANTNNIPTSTLGVWWDPYGSAALWINSDLSDVQYLVLERNSTIQLPTNYPHGQVIKFHFLQDATGGWTLSFIGAPTYLTSWNDAGNVANAHSTLELFYDEPTQTFIQRQYTPWGGIEAPHHDYLVVNDSGAATGDARMESDTEANMFLLDASADTLYLGGSANCVSIAKGGTVALTGTAKYERHVQLTADLSGAPASQPTLVTVGTASALQFASSGTEYAYVTWEVPDDWDGTSITLEVDWLPDSGAMSGSDTVKFTVAWRCIAEGETLTNGTIATAYGTAVGDYAQYKTDHMGIAIAYDNANQPMTTQDHVYFQISRDTGVANDFAGTVAVTAFEIIYQSTGFPSSN